MANVRDYIKNKNKPIKSASKKTGRAQSNNADKENSDSCQSKENLELVTKEAK